MYRILIVAAIIFTSFSTYAVEISSFPWSMTSSIGYRDDCNGTSGLCGCSVEWLPTSGWNGNGAYRINPPTSCRGQNGQYCGPGTFNFPSNPQSDVYIRFLVRFSANWEENAQDCGLNKQVKFIISHPETRGMLIYQDAHSIDGGYQFAPCENNGCAWKTDDTRTWWSSDYSERWVSVEVHFDGNDNRVELWIQTSDNVFRAVEGLPYQTTAANIGSPIINFEGLGQFFNGSFAAGTWLELSDVVVDSNYIGPPEDFDTETYPRVPSNFLTD